MGFVLPVTTAVGDFFELASGFVEQRVGFGVTLGCARLGAFGSKRNLISHRRSAHAVAHIAKEHQFRPSIGPRIFKNSGPAKLVIFLWDIDLSCVRPKTSRGASPPNTPGGHFTEPKIT